MVQVLCLDAAGSPREWLSVEGAAKCVARGIVAWELGETCHTLRGGLNAITGRMSTIEVKPIISILSPVYFQAVNRTPQFGRSVLLRRDRLTCAYCGQVFRELDLTLDHIHPQSRGGLTDYMNIVASCRLCNNIKDCRTPEEAHMPLLYVPYVPSLQEKFILENRVILADQAEFLKASVPKDSRLWS